MAPNLTSETRSVSGFDRVVMTDTGTLLIQQGEMESLTIQASPEMLEKIKSEVRDGTLTIGLKGWLDRILPIGEREIHYTLLVKDLSSLRISGAVDAHAASLSAKDFEVGVSGSADVRIDELTAETLKVGVSGSGDFRLAGRVQSQEVRISGSAKVQAGDLESQKASVRISGSGHAVLQVSESLDVRVSGAGTVEYKGSPKVSQSISGVGSVRQV